MMDGPVGIRYRTSQRTNVEGSLQHKKPDCKCDRIEWDTTG